MELVTSGSLLLPYTAVVTWFMKEFILLLEGHHS